MDKRAFGVVTFARSKEQTRIPLANLSRALEASLGINVVSRRERLFGPKVHRFTYMGETVRVDVLGNGNASFDLGSIDDEVRETLLEKLRHSFEFEAT